MLQNLKAIALVKLKGLKFQDLEYLKKHPRNKGKYREAKNFIDPNMMLADDMFELSKEIQERWYNN